MIPKHFLSMVRAESRVVFSRAAGLVPIGVGLGVGLLIVGLVGAARALTAGNPPESLGPLALITTATGVQVAGWALWARNFFVLPLFLLMLTGNVFSGEIADHTLRELLVRPVTRSSVALAKIVALALLSGATLLATLVPTLTVGLGLFGSDGPIVDLLLGYGVSWVSDLGLIGLGVLASVLLRGSAAVVVSVIGLLMADLIAQGVLAAMQARGLEIAGTLGAMLPGAAMAAWKGWQSGWHWQPFVGLAVLISVSLGLALLRLNRMDVA